MNKVTFIIALIVFTSLKVNSQHILTPKLAKEAQANAVRIYGVRPGNEFRYKIPITGLTCPVPIQNPIRIESC